MGGRLMDKSELESRNIEAMEEDHMEKLYNSKNPLVKYIHFGKLKKIVDLIPKKKNMKILDAGCGEGHLLFEVSKFIDSSNELYGTDILDVALEKAKERMKEGDFSLQNLESLNFKNNSFDVIICTDVIEHIPNYKKVLSELKRVLKEDGTLIDNGKPKLVKNLNTIPYADYSDIDLSKYKKCTLSITTSRGCINYCAFCSERPNFHKYRYRTHRRED